MNKRIDNSQLQLELLNCPEFDLDPDDILQMDILPTKPPSGGLQDVITALDVFSSYSCISCLKPSSSGSSKGFN